MKTTKLFFMAALALLMTAACSSNDDELAQQPVEQPANNMITITAKLAPKTSVSGTRAVVDQSTYIESKWAENEHLAILYEKDGNQMADAEITAVDGTTGEATITFAVEAGTADDTYCQIIYPYSAAKDDKTGVKDNSTLLGAQDGTLNANLDVRVGAGTIQTSTPSLTVTTQPKAQFAIWKLTLPQASKDMYVISEAGEFLAGAILSGTGTDFTVAVPAVSSKVTIVATDGTSGCWSYSNTATLETGKYYQSTLTSMTALGTESSADVYMITGTSDFTTTIENGKTVVLSNATFHAPVICSGNANIMLMGGTNQVLNDYSSGPGIQIGGAGTTLTITGSGSLNVKGSSSTPGIGTNSKNDNITGGAITINGGTITAQGGSGAAGIGTGYAKNYLSNPYTNTCGAITINGGTITATGGDLGAGIGTGISNQSSNTCGTITINGGTVVATGGSYSAGIGTGLAMNGGNTCGAITIGTGVTSVTAKKSSSNPGPNSIGKGNVVAGGTQTCGTITIGGDATTYAAGVTTSPFTYPTAP